VRAYYEHYYRDCLGLGRLEERIQKRIIQARGKRFHAMVDELLGSPSGLDILDVGCGTGELLAQFATRGHSLSGIEPNEAAVDLARKLVPEAQILLARGEALPFPDASHDLVTSFHVLEHVVSPEKTLDEMIRVLRQGGSLFVECPNYLYPEEGHYEIAWLPFLPKRLGRTYLSLRGRPTGFIEHIRYVHPYRLERALQRYQVEVKDLSRESLRRSIPQKKLPRRWMARAALYARCYSPLQYWIAKRSG
jgi:ubiquinone/menaquinone biosynthesis C-methylase UbiE